MIVLFFVLGYLAIVFEHQLGLNKSSVALLTGVACWTAYVVDADPHFVNEALLHHLGDIAQIVFFLLGAMTIVEIVDAHDGFEIITSRVTSTSRRSLLVTIAVVSFFLSAVLDNLTTSIVMMSLVRKLTNDERDRMYFGGVVIIAANSGGAWSPIGDVTTTMLWVGGQITTPKIVANVILPSIASVAVPVTWLALRLKGDLRRPVTQAEPLAISRSSADEAALAGAADLASVTLTADSEAVGRTLADLNLRARTGASVVAVAREGGRPMVPSPREPLRAGDALSIAGEVDQVRLALDLLITGNAPKPTTATERILVFAAGVAVLVFVPVFKTLTHLPPFMGIMLGLGLLWTLTEILHKGKLDEQRGALSVSEALRRVDSQSVLFFLGILLAVGVLQTAGHLPALAAGLDRAVGNVDVITVLIGLSSSVVDNVPLVAAAQGMYPLSKFPVDHHFWLFLAYCAGTGGSILIIGSAAGIAVMGIQRITFGWYFRHMSLPALAGYAAGALVYLATAAVGG